MSGKSIGQGTGNGQGLPPGAAEAADNRRWAHRRPQMTPALIISDRLQVNQPCVVRDMSSTGAKLEVVYDKAALSRSVPDSFKLVLRNDRSEVDCEVAWRNRNMVGVRFLSALRIGVVKPKAPAPGLAGKGPGLIPKKK